MVNFIRQNEIEELTELLSNVGILSVVQVKSLLKRRGKTDEQIEIILNQLVKRKFAYYDESQNYLRTNKAIKTSDLDRGYVKSVWLLIDLLNSIGDYFIIHNAVKKLTFINKKIDNSKNDPFFDVFYIPFDTEKINCYQMQNEKKDNMKSKCFILIDDASQIEKINLDDRFNIVNFATVSSDGNVEYFNKN